MRFTVSSDSKGVNIPEFVFDSEDNDLRTAIENMAGGTIAAMFHFAKSFSEDPDKTKMLFDSLLDYISMAAEDYFTEEETPEEEYRYEEWENEFITWIYNQGYDDVYAFMDVYEGTSLKLDFNATCADVEVYLADENGQRLETIGEIPSYLFIDEPDMAAAQCVEYNSIAVLAFDRLYTHEKNPLRRLPVTDLERRIREEVL